mmetsp:Transcript_60134/g.73658  ORF Transcript_60134/g.73658 Transcript_60134/m.73658 type:complete len:356 (+) Transcript_60134:144-1211(+)
MSFSVLTSNHRGSGGRKMPHTRSSCGYSTTHRGTWFQASASAAGWFGLVLLRFLEADTREQGLVDVGHHTSSSNGGLHQAGQLLITTDGNLQMPRSNALHMVVTSNVAGQLQHLSCQVFHDCCGEDTSRATHTALGSGIAFQKAMDASHWEDAACPARARRLGLGLLHLAQFGRLSTSVVFPLVHGDRCHFTLQICAILHALSWFFVSLIHLHTLVCLWSLISLLPLLSLFGLVSLVLLVLVCFGLVGALVNIGLLQVSFLSLGTFGFVSFLPFVFLGPVLLACIALLVLLFLCILEFLLLFGALGLRALGLLLALLQAILCHLACKFVFRELLVVFLITFLAVFAVFRSFHANL